MSTITPKISKKRKLYFNFLFLIFPVLILLVFELLLRTFSYGNNMHLFIKHPNKNYKDYYIVNPHIGEKYFNKFDATGATNDIFLKDKPKNGYRIFVLGSSTVVGFPYDKNLMFSRILHKRLQDAYPDKHIEVINSAITAINSITLNDFTKEIVKHEPDAILIYAGHNEYYGAFGIGSNETMSRNTALLKVHFSLMNLRIYQFIRSTMTSFANLFQKAPDNADAKGSLMKRIVNDKEILYKSEKYNIGINQYVTNISEILNRASKNNIQVFISDLVSNVKDLPPFGSASSPEFPEASLVYNQAQESLKMKDTLKAKELFYYAKDLDPVRFKATEELNGIIDSLAKNYNCFFVPTKKAFSDASAGGLIGNNLLTEHVHPNIYGQFIMADAFFTQIINSKLIEKEADVYSTYPFNHYRRNWGYSELDSLIGEYRLKQLKSYWPFVSLENNITFRDTYKTSSTIDSLAFSVILTSEPNIEKLHLYLAEKYFDNNNYTKAFKEYQTLAYINPYRPDYYNNAANCLFKLRDLFGAEKYLKQSIIYQKTFFAYFMIAEIDIIKHDFSAAIKAYETALQLADNKDQENQILEKLYLAYHYNNDLELQNKTEKRLIKRSIEYIKSIPELPFSYSNYIPQNVERLIQKANEHILQSDIDSAMFFLFESININDTPLANRLIGDILFQRKDNRLLFYYNKAYSSFEYEPSFLINYCIANYVNSDFSAAKKTLSKLKTIAPKNTEIPKLEELLTNK